VEGAGFHPLGNKGIRKPQGKAFEKRSGKENSANRYSKPGGVLKLSQGRGSVSSQESKLSQPRRLQILARGGGFKIEKKDDLRRYNPEKHHPGQETERGSLLIEARNEERRKSALVEGPTLIPFGERQRGAEAKNASRRKFKIMAPEGGDPVYAVS